MESQTGQYGLKRTDITLNRDENIPKRDIQEK